MIMKYLHEKMNEAILDQNKISIANQTILVQEGGVSSLCIQECLAIFGLLFLMIGIDSGII